MVGKAIRSSEHVCQILPNTVRYALDMLPNICKPGHLRQLISDYWTSVLARLPSRHWLLMTRRRRLVTWTAQFQVEVRGLPCASRYPRSAAGGRQWYFEFEDVTHPEGSIGVTRQRFIFQYRKQWRDAEENDWDGFLFSKGGAAVRASEREKQEGAFARVR
jgi:hypothetical protein